MLYLLNKKRIILKLKKLKKKWKKREEEDEGTNKIGISPSFLHKRAHFNKISLPKGEFFFLVVKDEFDINF